MTARVKLLKNQLFDYGVNIPSALYPLKTAAGKMRWMECPKCQGEMVKGWMPEYSRNHAYHHYHPHQLLWTEGDPELNILGGILPPEEATPVESW